MIMKFALQVLERTPQTVRKYCLNVTTKPLSIMLLEDSNRFITKKGGKPKVTLDKESLSVHRSIYLQMIKDSILRNDEELEEVIKRFDKVADYTGPNRELYPSPTLVNAYKALQQDLTTEKIRQACILAWCLEMSTTGMVLIDDVLDKCKLRWKKLCWHEKHGIGPTVTLDIRQFFIGGPVLLKKYFKDHPSYVRLAELLSECLQLTCYGQAFDTILSNEFKNTRDLNFVSTKTYHTVMKYKASYIMFKYPVLAAIYFDNTTNPKLYNKVLDVLEKFTYHFQVLNDTWDCFGKYRSTGKFGTDIREGKCTWLTSKLLDCGTKGQIELFHKNYAREDDDECERVIKNLYRELGIFEMYRQHKLQLRRYAEEQVDRNPNPGLVNIIQFLVDTYLEAEVDFDE